MKDQPLSDPDRRSPEKIKEWIDSNASPDVLDALSKRDGSKKLVDLLKAEFPPEKMSDKTGYVVWEQIGVYYIESGRPHIALFILFALYDQMLRGQSTGRIPKGTPLCWISDCFRTLGCPVHSKRYLMLTLCEDALSFKEKGIDHVPADRTGVYFRLVWIHGLSDIEFEYYTKEFVRLWEADKEAAKFPEALLQQVQDGWLTELPTPNEIGHYWINESYGQSLIDKIGVGDGRALEILAQYLLSCMPGCRPKRRLRTYSTDFDIACAMEGFDLDFRSEFGRYFVCECKDWNEKADFTTMAKFCRVLDSTKAKFGILFSRNGISGVPATEHAAREQLKIFQDRGIVIVVITLFDLETTVLGENFTQLLRQRYEEVRLDLRQPGSLKKSKTVPRSRKPSQSKKKADPEIQNG